MKSEHRHDLKTNELRRLAEQIRPFLEKHANKVVLGLCGVIVVAAGVIYWSRSSTASAAAAWSQFSSATNAEEFANVAEKHSGTQVAAWARLMEAQNHLGSGIQLMFTDRNAAVSDLKAAEASFQKILGDSSTPDEVVERALFGMARCRESQSDSNTLPAIEAYQRLVDDFPDSVYKELAEKRIDILKTQEAKQFYAWFDKQQPKPEDRALPFDGQPFQQGIELPPIPESLRLREPVGNGDSAGTTGEQPTAQEPAVAKKPADAEKGPELKPPVQPDNPTEPNSESPAP